MTLPRALLLSLLTSVAALSAAGCAANADSSDDPSAQPAEEDDGAGGYAAESVLGPIAVGAQLRTTAALRLRNGPSTSAGIILVIPAGAIVTVVASAPSGGWYHVGYSGHEGWSYGTYLDRVSGSSSPPPPSSGGGLSCSHVQWWNSALTYSSMSYGWHDTDLDVRHGTPVQLRHASRLDKHGVYGWGWMPEFTDLVTGQRFRFLHLLPSDRYTTSVGTTYAAGTVVGLSGGDTKDTGLGTYSTGQHLCVQSLAAYRSVFPAGHDACK